MNMQGHGMMDPHAGHANNNTTTDTETETDSCANMNMMMMFFHTGSCEYVLFEKFRVTTPNQMVGATIVVFLLSLFYEALKHFREFLLRTITCTSLCSPPGVVLTRFESLKKGMREQMLSCGHLVQVGLHLVQVFYSYALMMLFMTFNVWFCVAIVIGAGVGYFLFGWKRVVVVAEVGERCH